MILAGWFISGVEMTGSQRLLLMLPLCLSIAIVYKMTRCEDPRRAPLAALLLWGTIVVGMFAVGVGLWALFSVFA